MTPEEQAIHDNAVAFAKANKGQRCAALTDPNIYLPEKNPVSVFMAGSPGAGKTESARNIIAQLEAKRPAGKVLRIDPDDLRSEFPGYNCSSSWLFQTATAKLIHQGVDTIDTHCPRAFHLASARGGARSQK